MDLYYSAHIEEKEIRLEGDEAHHLLNVLRHRIGDKVMVTDGKGTIYTTELSDDRPKNCLLTIKSKSVQDDSERSTLHIGIAPTKNSDRFEWFLEKATEIGIGEISPVICKHSERRIIKEERLNKVLIAAMKQSLKATLPFLHPLRTFTSLLEQCRETQRYICTLDADESLSARYKKEEACIILIGPEGDFSKDETELAKKHGFIPVSLGHSRLRTETAGIMACAVVALASA